MRDGNGGNVSTRLDTTTASERRDGRESDPLIRLESVGNVFRTDEIETLAKEGRLDVRTSLADGRQLKLG